MDAVLDGDQAWPVIVLATTDGPWVIRRQTLVLIPAVRHIRVVSRRADVAIRRPIPTHEVDALESSRPRAVPFWVTWAPRTAVLWALIQGAVRAWWAVVGAPPVGPLGRDLIAFNGWGAVGLFAAAAGVAFALMKAPWRWPLFVAGWAVAAALFVAGALLLLDVVGALLPGLGVPFQPLGFASRTACVVEAILLGATAVAYRRRWRSECLFCGRTGDHARAATPPWWAWVAAYTAVAACVVRFGAQLAVGFEGFLVQLSPSLLIFELGFVLAGTVLPLALVHSWGRVFPRWVPVLAGRPIPRWLLLGPGFGIAGGLTAYFGVSLVMLAAATLGGSSTQMTGSLPLAFFWVAMPAYFVWGLGLGAAALAYYRVTRPRCRRCGL